MFMCSEYIMSFYECQSAVFFHDHETAGLFIQQMKQYTDL